MRRFWTETSWQPDSGGFRILLDSRPVRLPGGAALRVSSERLAEAIAGEWQNAGQDGRPIAYADLPLTRIAGTAQERIAANPAPTVAAIAKYAESDLLCYRAETPEELIRRQARGWQPWLQWAAQELDAPLYVTTGVMHIAQPPDSLRALRHALAAQDAAGLAALAVAVPALGSLVLGLALAAGRLEAEAAYALSVIDETFQEELWGVDSIAAQRRRSIAAEVTLAARFLALARSKTDA